MAAIIVRIDDGTLGRLEDLSAALDVDVSTVIGLLLDRDPHTHDHRCPTCVRLARVEADVSAHEGQDPLFETGG